MSTLETITFRLTKDNLDDLHAGDVFVEDREFGPVRSARMGVHSDDYAMISSTTGMRDAFGIPQTVTVERVVHETVYPRTEAQKRSC